MQEFCGPIRNTMTAYYSFYLLGSMIFHSWLSFFLVFFLVMWVSWQQQVFDLCFIIQSVCVLNRQVKVIRMWGCIWKGFAVADCSVGCWLLPLLVVWGLVCLLCWTWLILPYSSLFLCSFHETFFCLRGRNCTILHLLLPLLLLLLFLLHHLPPFPPPLPLYNILLRILCNSGLVVINYLNLYLSWNTINFPSIFDIWFCWE